MFKKLHTRLTLLSGAVSTFILCIMSLCFLYVSESSQRQNGFISFRTDMNSFLTSLEQQQTISHSWLKKMEGGKYKIYLEDDGGPFVYNALTFQENDIKIVEEILDYYRNSADYQDISEYKSQRMEYAFSEKKLAVTPVSKATHFAGCMTLLKNGAPLTAVVLAPQYPLIGRLRLQRLFFLVINLAGGLFFFLFALIFTGRLIAPIEDSQKRQAEFLSLASHELRTPLAVILASVSACEIAPPEEQKRFFSNIKREGKRMQGLITDMLWSVRGQREKAPLQKEAADPETLLLNVYEAFEPLAEEKKLTLSICLPGETPSSCLCDTEKICQLLSVFVHNAISYTPPGGRVTLSLTVKPKAFLFSVADTGPGIPDAEKKRVFERFYRSEAAHSQKEHFGLGLSIAKEIAAAHHGLITVTDNTPCGSVFTLRLPRTEK